MYINVTILLIQSAYQSTDANIISMHVIECRFKIHALQTTWKSCSMDAPLCKQKSKQKKTTQNIAENEANEIKLIK